MTYENFLQFLFTSSNSDLHNKKKYGMAQFLSIP